MSFVHLHNHTEYSLLDGANRIPDMVGRAKELGMEALAISDHGVMFGVMEFYWECQRQGVKPILGVEAYVAPNGHQKKSGREENETYHLLLLARDLEGYRNLCKLSSIAATNPDNSTLSAQYDREDNLVAATDELGHVTTWTYDSAGRPTQSVNARGDIESFGYNANDWQTTSTNGRNYTQTLSYTARGELWKLVLPDGATEYSSYDGRGNQTTYTNPLANAIQYVYSQVGNLATVDYPTGTDTQFTYDSLNRVATMLDATGQTTWTRDNAGWLTTLATPQGNVGYTYNNAGQRLTMNAYSEGTTNYTYDTSGRLATLRNGLNETTTFDYDTLSRITRKTLQSGAKEDYVFDNRSRPTSITLKKNNNQLLSSQSYTYDVVGNVLTHTQDGVQTTYGYDAIDQILSEARSGYAASYTYDGNGNRLTKTLNGVTENYAYDLGDKLLDVRVGGNPVKTYGYDAAGRTTSVVSAAGTTTLAYDFEDRLTSISGGGVSASTYAYNGLDTRVSRSGSSNQTFKRDGVGVTSPVLNDGLAGFTPGISERRSGSTTYSHAGLKNNAVQTGASQTVTASKTYDAFGLLATSTGTWKGPFSYGGPFGYQEDSESGLKLLGHRYYDPSTGRFLTRDPNGNGSNWYSYSANSPMALADPTGLKHVLIVVVDGLPNENATPARFIELAQKLKKFVEDNGDTATILYGPSEEQFAHSMKRADGLIYIGHGGTLGANVSYGRRSGRAWILNPDRLKAMLNGRKLAFIVLATCSALRDRNTMLGFAALCQWLFGFTALSPHVLPMLDEWDDWKKGALSPSFPRFRGRGAPLSPKHLGY